MPNYEIFSSKKHTQRFFGLSPPSVCIWFWLGVAGCRWSSFEKSLFNMDVTEFVRVMGVCCSDIMEFVDPKPMEFLSSFRPRLLPLETMKWMPDCASSFIWSCCTNQHKGMLNSALYFKGLLHVYHRLLIRKKRNK